MSGQGVADQLTLVAVEQHLSEEVKAKIDAETVAGMVKEFEGKLKQRLDSECATADARVALLTSLLVEQYRETCKVRKDNQSWKRKHKALTQEQEQQLEEHKKYASKAQKLESICREMEKRNKSLVEELKELSSKSQFSLHNMQAKYEASVQTVNEQLKEHIELRIKTMEENESLRTKLQQLLKLEEVRAQQHSYEMQKHKLESELAEAKLKQQMEIALAESRKAKLLRDKLNELTQSEDALKAQIGTYAEKFGEIQDTMKKSDSVFTSIRTDLEKRTRQLIDAEKEISTLKKDKKVLENMHSKSQLTLIQLTEERQAQQLAVEKAQRQKDKLEQLCKLLEKDRAKLKEELDQIKTASLAAAVGAPAVAPAASSAPAASEEQENKQLSVEQSPASGPDVPPSPPGPRALADELD